MGITSDLMCYQTDYCNRVGRLPETYWATKAEFDAISRIAYQAALFGGLGFDENNIKIYTDLGVLNIKLTTEGW